MAVEVSARAAGERVRQVLGTARTRSVGYLSLAYPQPLRLVCSLSVIPLRPATLPQQQEEALTEGNSQRGSGL